MPGMLPQTKQAITALLEAGLTRNQFNVKTPFNKGRGGYDPTEVTVFTPAAYQTVYYSARRLLDSGFDVTLYYIADAPEEKPSLVALEVVTGNRPSRFTVRRADDATCSFGLVKGAKPYDAPPVPEPPATEPPPRYNTTLTGIRSYLAPAKGFYMLIQREYNPETAFKPYGGTIAAIVFVKQPSFMGRWECWDKITPAITGPLRKHLDSDMYEMYGSGIKKGRYATQIIPPALERQFERNPDTPVFYAHFDILTGTLTPVLEGTTP